MVISKPVPGKAAKKRKLTKPAIMESDDEFDENAAFQELKQILPTACILTKADSDTDTASEDEDLPPVRYFV